MGLGNPSVWGGLWDPGKNFRGLDKLVPLTGLLAGYQSERLTADMARHQLFCSPGSGWVVILQFMRALEGPGTRTTEHSGGWSSRQGLFGNQWRSVFRHFNNQDCCVGTGELDGRFLGSHGSGCRHIWLQPPPSLGPWGWFHQDSISLETSLGQGHLTSSCGKKLDSQD